MELKYKIKKTDNFQNINEVLSLKFGISTRLLSKLIRNNLIYKNGVSIDTRLNVIEDDIITVDFNYDEDNSNIVPTKINLDIIYEDEWMLVINKNCNMPVHPSCEHYLDSSSNGVRYYFDSIGLKKKIRPVNRLDLGTSGLVIFAKCEYIQEAFIKQMKNNNFKKIYLCLVQGILEKKHGTINLPIARKQGSIIERCIDRNGQPSITHYLVKQEFGNYSLVECLLETGRTHQIRVHMANIGHPILGDTLYGTTSNIINRQALHSYKISCIHPVSKKQLEFVAPAPF